MYLIKTRLYFLLLLPMLVSLSNDDPVNLTEGNYVKAPFNRLDTYCTNDWWNRGKNEIIDLKVERDEVIAFGLYTVSGETLKLSAQLFPLYPAETRTVRLELKKGDVWEEVQTQLVNELGWSATFQIENWDHTQDCLYRIRHYEDAIFEGIVRKDPKDQDEIVIAALSCNSNKDRGGREQYVRNINHQNPDFIFFAGDQSYDHREHTAAWLLFGMQFRELFRNRPCVTIPDDHDVGMYNLWGDGGQKGRGIMAFSGGYRFHPEYVKMVERCQTAHLPDPYDPTLVNQGIGVYYTSLLLGGVDFAILEDRKFKSGPKGAVSTRMIRKDLPKNKSENPSEFDREGLSLLGDRQHEFLKEWAGQNTESIKVVLSQTAFFSGPHLSGKRAKRHQADFDSNGWPQTGRNEALRLIREANAIHIAGDQHIAFAVQHGVEQFEDGPWEFTVPAIVNSIYERWWWPESEKAGENANNRLPWTGQYQDGFGNKITMHAYANPDGPSSGAGYGLVRFYKSTRQVVFECWPRESDVRSTDAKQFTGWPIQFTIPK